VATIIMVSNGSASGRLDLRNWAGGATPGSKAQVPFPHICSSYPRCFVCVIRWGYCLYVFLLVIWCGWVLSADVGVCLLCA